MMKYSVGLIIGSVLLSACSASTAFVGSVVLPTSNKKIDVVQSRTDSKECAVGWTLQTFDAAGQMVDAKSGEGNALHCQLLGAAIDAGGRVGQGAVGAARTSISNAQGQGQFQGQHQSQKQDNGKKDHGRGGHGGGHGYDVE